MKKIPSLFERDWEGDRSRVLPIVNPECQWVIDGEGIATEKFDGTAIMVRGGTLYKRYDVKQGRTPPEGFEAAQEPDPLTGHWPGWVPVGVGPEDRWAREAEATQDVWRDGTFELVGPKVQGNPYRLPYHTFWRHGIPLFGEDVPPRDFEGIKDYLSSHAIEGIVWHHEDGRMAKIKAKDFGLVWPR